MSKFFSYALCLLLLLVLLPGCSKKEEAVSKDGVITVKLWVAPSKIQEEFWGGVIQKFNSKNTDIQVEYTVIPTGSGSSEDIILTAIATGNAPDMSTNIFAGFAAQLSDNNAIVPLENLQGFNEVIKTRAMEDIIKGWKSGDGHTYVMPLYSSPTLWWWNQELLDTIGFEGVPSNFDDVFAICEEIKKINSNSYAITWPGNKWWSRWFGFISTWYATTGGDPYLDSFNGKVLFNTKDGLEIIENIKKGFDNGCIAKATGSDDLFPRGKVVGVQAGPWSIEHYESNYPDLKYTVGTPLAAGDTKNPVHSFADTKGMVIFSSSKKQAAAWKFMNWFFSNPEFDKEWLDKTFLPPSRADLLDNPLFVNFWEANTIMAPYAKYGGSSLPPALTSLTAQIQDIMYAEMIEPIQLGSKEAQEALDDVQKAIEDVIAKSR